MEPVGPEGCSQTLGQCVGFLPCEVLHRVLALNKRCGGHQHRAWFSAGPLHPSPPPPPGKESPAGSLQSRWSGNKARHATLPQPSCPLLLQTCCSTSPTAGTWPSTTRAASSRCGSTRARTCSSLATWRCSSRGSWMTPPHLSLGRRSWQPSLRGEGIRAPRGEGLGRPGTWGQRRD